METTKMDVTDLLDRTVAVKEIVKQILENKTLTALIPEHRLKSLQSIESVENFSSTDCYVGINFANDLSVYIAESHAGDFEFVEDVVTGNEYVIYPTIEIDVSWPGYCSMGGNRALGCLEGWQFVIQTIQRIVQPYSGIQNKKLIRTKEEVELAKEKAKEKEEERKRDKFKEYIANELKTAAKGFRVGSFCHIDVEYGSDKYSIIHGTFTVEVGKKEFTCEEKIGNYKCTRVK